MEFTMFLIVLEMVKSTLQVNIIKSIVNTQYNGMFEYQNSLKIKTVSTMVECTMECNENDQCVSLFYNDVTKQCVMHSKDFTFQSPSGTDSGWKHLIIRDVSGRCPEDFLYYRRLDFCYKAMVQYPIDFPQIKANCTSEGGKFAAITSSERHEYFSSFLADRPHPRVCIAGNKQWNSNIYFLDDGTQLIYIDWASTDPDGGNIQLCLVMMYDKMLDVGCSYDNTCIFVCEI